MYLQDVLKTVDRETVAKAYRKLYSFRRKRRISRKKSIRIFISIISKLIDELLSISPIYHDECTLHIKYIEDLGYDVFYTDKSEGVDDASPWYGYSILCTPWEDVLGYVVDDSIVTSEDKNKLIANILFEITWFGITQKTVEKNTPNF